MHIFGNVVEADGVSPAIITVEHGKITSFRRTPDTLALAGNPHSYNLNRFIIFPGFIDIHTQSNDDFLSTGLAAINGGVTFIGDVSSTVTTKDAYVARMKEAAKCPVGVVNYCCMSENSEHIGDVPYQAYLGTINGSAFSDYSKLSQKLGNFHDRSVSFHCEDPNLVNVYRNEKNHEHRHPAMTEYTAADVILDFIESYRLHGIIPTSTVHLIDGIKAAKKRGVNVQSAVTPHHLFFDFAMITNENRRFLQTSPPLRSSGERSHLLHAVKQGDIDFLASGHCAVAVKDKLRGALGMPHLDTYGAFVTWLLKSGVDPVVLFKMACQNPGEWVNKFSNRKVGRLLPGYEASIVVLDLQKSAVDGRPLYSKAGWSAFDLRTLPGSVQTVFLKGEKVVDGLFIRSEQPA